MTDADGLAGKTVLITGAAGPGVGGACARLFAQQDALVVLSDRSRSRTYAAAEQVGQATGARVVPLVMDVGDEQSINGGLAEIADTLGPVDVLVNNAAFTGLWPLVETSTQDWNRVLGVCLTGAFLTMRACLPAMIRRGSGAIVNVSSVNAWTGPGDGTSAYSAAKAGLLGLTRAAASECGPHNVRVNAVAPGLVPNPGVEQLFGAEYIARVSGQAAMRRAATPEEIAEAVVFLSGRRSGFVTGEVINVSGGLYFHA
jgi:3-oxoacyl-[acyl-carrier protein] reductase